MAHGSSSSSGNPYNNSYGNYANDNPPKKSSPPAANQNTPIRTVSVSSSGSVATTKLGAYSSPSVSIRGNASAEFFASRANANYSRGSAPSLPSQTAQGVPGVTPAPLQGAGNASTRLASSKLRGSKLRIAVAPSVAATKLGSPVRSPTVRASDAARAIAAMAPRAAVTPNSPAFVGYDATSGSRSKAAESRDVRCKPRPEDNTPKGGGGGGRRKFVPWCG